jgi:TolA-binding protein
VRSKFPNSTKVPFAMHNQAVAHSRLGQTEEAIRLMQAVVDQFPMSPVAEQAKSDLKRLKGEQ